MSSEPQTPDDRDPEPDPDKGLTRPEPNDDTAPDADPDEVEPAFDIDLEPEEQGLADTGGEPTG
jgi:hypothetical protein